MIISIVDHKADEFRTEPPFRLQGSYRNMNRLAEKVVNGGGAPHANLTD